MAMASHRGNATVATAAGAVTMLICFCASCIAQATSQAGTDDGLIVAQARAAKAARDYDAVLRLLAGTKSADGLWLKAWVFAHRSV